jgi:hypothetical protein
MKTASPLSIEMHHARLLLMGLALADLAVCSGCVFFNPTAESWVEMRGKVENVQADTTCTIRLLTENGRLVREQAVGPEFRRTFTIAPGNHSYYLGVACAGQPGSFKSKLYQLGARTNEVDLGSILLR